MIATLRNLLAAATPGRWGAFGYGDDWAVEGHQLNSFSVAARAPEANAALIAAMHEALPALLAAAEEMVALADVDSRDLFEEGCDCCRRARRIAAALEGKA